ncbi:conserved domain protein [Hyphomonas neptunium ATCC 15444]|uniref:Conserved domain protein n=2 Tax=Hyphomonas TaxID=85 RepID=Q0C050_HYPNA|nr:conserved domain protein [Hyphomonas neptunium ATCC 15444]
MPTGVIPEIRQEIALIGQQTRDLATRYEQVFVNLRQALQAALAQAAGAAQRARIAMTIADAAASAISENFPNQPLRACAAGCGACCHLYVMVPPGVAEAVAAHVLRRLDAKGLAGLRLDLERAAAAAGALTDPSRLKHRCPLLGDDNLCTVYDARPPACRAFTSHSAAACRSLAFDPEGPVTAIPQSASHFRVYQEATGALQRAARAGGQPSAQTGLAAALLVALPEQA